MNFKEKLIKNVKEILISVSASVIVFITLAGISIFLPKEFVTLCISTFKLIPSIAIYILTLFNNIVDIFININIHGLSAYNSMNGTSIGFFDLILLVAIGSILIKGVSSLLKETPK